MTNAEEALLERWSRERPVYDVWGRFIEDKLATGLRRELGDDVYSNFLKMCISVRTKEPESFVEKVFYRKTYENPYEDAEDKVGIRLVVLLEEDIRTIEQVLLKDDNPWTAEKSRDHEEEIASKPYEFNYQSLHYVVRSKAGLEFDGTSLYEDMPCEIQIRTLLQHAYSELTHDTIYKPSVVATSEMKRAAAKSMALIEATGDYFSALDGKIKEATSIDRSLSQVLEKLYKDVVGKDPSPSSSPLNQMLIDRYRGDLDEHAQELKDWFSSNDYLAHFIRERSEHRAPFKLSGILLAYFAVAKSPRASAAESPLLDADLGHVYSDQGKAL